MRWLFAPGHVAILSMLGLLAAIGTFLYFLSEPPSSRPGGEPVVVYCAEALRLPMEAIAAEYEKETGQRIEARFGPSQDFFFQGEVLKAGDLYLPADDSYLAVARDKKLICEVLPVATMSAVVVANPNARAIQSWDDLVHPEIELVLANTESAAVGKLTKASLVEQKLWAQIEKRRPVFQAKISDVASAVLLNPRGAGVVFDAVAKQYPKLVESRLPELASIKANVAIAVTSYSKQPTEALRFARYVAAKDRGLVELKKRGYSVVEVADEFEVRPEIHLFGGSMLRPAIEDTIREFEAREGCKVLTTWNGCGILVAQMNASADPDPNKPARQFPDVYFACEPRFLDKVKKHFGEPELVSTNRLVIATAKGNPHGIKTLKDLGQKEVKLGIGNENQCAMGDLTKTAFIRSKTYDQILRNVRKQAPSGDMLIADFRSGALEVIVCYESNVTPFLDDPRIPMDFVPIQIGDENRDCTNPLQPVAICKTSRHPQLSRRLLDSFQTPQSRVKFERLGFGWVKAE